MCDNVYIYIVGADIWCDPLMCFWLWNILYVSFVPLLEFNFCFFQPGRKKVYNMEPRTPLKRQRIPVQRFQSPVLEEGAPKPKIPTEEKILLFKKELFLLFGILKVSYFYIFLFFTISIYSWPIVLFKS